MIRHIVLFRFKDHLSNEVKEQVRNQFREDILALKTQLSIIREIEVGFNENEAEQWDICLNGLFDTIDDVKEYSVFPNHQAAAAKLKPYLQGRSCVDYVTML